MADLTTKTARSKLPPRREPHWMKLGKGFQLGYRVPAGTWLAKYRKTGGNAGKKTNRPIESLGEFEDFSAAKAAAERWAAKFAGNAYRVVNRGTVRDALAAYVRNLRELKRHTTAWEVGQRFRLTVPRGSSFGAMRLEDVHQEDVKAWRKALRKGRTDRSVMRQYRAVRAGARWSLKNGGFSGRLDAWALEPLVDDREKETAVFIDADQRARLIQFSPPALAALLTGWAHTGTRPSELAQAVVKDFDPRGSTVTVRHRKGRTSALKERAVILDDVGVEFFKSHARGKLPKAPLISAANGNHWSPFDWSEQIRAAAAAANKACKSPELRIPDGVSAYSIRHSRISELLQLGKLDPVSVAALCGTSVLMIEKFYFKFITSSIKERLNALRAMA